uniref:(northern house mosquito) hypothetical protein n=1 Tax=Culex pipiens TaxID=7175 RepID=A0A8D8JJD3_CULPI
MVRSDWMKLSRPFRRTASAMFFIMRRSPERNRNSFGMRKYTPKNRFMSRSLAVIRSTVGMVRASCSIWSISSSSRSAIEELQKHENCSSSLMFSGTGPTSFSICSQKWYSIASIVSVDSSLFNEILELFSDIRKGLRVRHGLRRKPFSRYQVYTYV